MYTYDPIELLSYAADLIHTKAVRGMRKTASRRPLSRGQAKRSQRWWMLMRPTLDILWFRSGPAYWRRELAARRALRARKGGAV